ncbi:hypothetical protein [Adhaeribacter aquaticus]|uniref:hypothetical protein n=1 Tax=Adhaeribacter aquaticus TaxID=299567 RepID=UPI000478D2DF|nr:hypothetical protein [Adhaeribacter aquaticus]
MATNIGIVQIGPVLPLIESKIARQNYVFEPAIQLVNIIPKCSPEQIGFFKTWLPYKDSLSRISLHSSTITRSQGYRIDYF